MARRPPSPRPNRASHTSRQGPADSTSAPSGTVEAQLAGLQGLFDQLKAQVRQVQQLANLGTAAATIAHEVNNLLTPVLAYCQAATDSGDAALTTRALEVTLKHVRMLIGMSERVLEIGAVGGVKRESAVLRDVVEHAKASLCRDPSKDGISFSNQVDESIRVWVDALQLQQVLFNLLLNAREVMAPKHQGRLTVSAKRQGDRIVIEVRNTGEPIPPDLLPHVFELLQTSKPAASTDQHRCSGLGLSLCRDLIEENDGTIGVRSGTEIGTTFTIDLPASDNNPG